MVCRKSFCYEFASNDCFVCFQVGAIKAEAVRISELCEDDFSELVLEARSFSLARPPPRRSSNPSLLACYTPEPDPDPVPPTHVETFEQEPQVDTLPDLPIFTPFTHDMASDDPPSEPYTPKFKSLERTSRRFNPQAQAKMTNLNDSELDRSMMNESSSDDPDSERGVFDYFRRSPAPIVKQELKSPMVNLSRTSPSPGMALGGDIAFSVDIASSDDSLKGSDEDNVEAYGISSNNPAPKKLFEDAYSGAASNNIEMKEISSTTTSYFTGEDEVDFFGRSLTGITYNRQKSTNTVIEYNNTEQYDEAIPAVDSDEEVPEELTDVVVEPNGKQGDKITVHKPYQDIPDRSNQSYTYIEDSNSLEEGPKRRTKPAQSSSPSQRLHQAKTETMYRQGLSMPYGSSNQYTTHSKAEVDKSIAFSSLGPRTKSSEGTNITSSIAPKAAFGYPPDSDKLNRKGVELLGDRKYETPSSMPYGEPLMKTDAARTSKKKKKSKTGGLDSLECEPGGCMIK